LGNSGLRCSRGEEGAPTSQNPLNPPAQIWEQQQQQTKQGKKRRSKHTTRFKRRESEVISDMPET